MINYLTKSETERRNVMFFKTSHYNKNIDSYSYEGWYIRLYYSNNIKYCITIYLDRCDKLTLSPCIQGGGTSHIRVIA